MNTKKIIVFLVICVCVVPAMVYAQSSGIEQRILGTWTDVDNSIWVFNANGTMTYQEEGYSATGIFGIAGFQMRLLTQDEEFLLDMFFSPDGRKLILLGQNGKQSFELVLNKKN